MPGRRGSAFDPIHLPDHVWRDNPDALRDRDIGSLFRLAKRYAGASQHRIATATGMPQSRVNQLMNDRCGPVTSIDVLHRIADGLNLPDHVRAALGLAPGPLAAYVRWVQSNTAYWQGDYRAAAQLAAAGLAEAAHGNEVLRLTSQQARAWAAAGRVDDCEAALSQAADARDRMVGEPRPEGVFSFPTGKAAYYASEVRLALGGTDNARRAVTQATEALALLETDPHTRGAAELHAATRLDLAAAHLRLGDLDAVAAHASLVLDLPAESRTVPIMGRMAGTYRALGEPGAVTSRQVLDLREQIEVFTAYPAARNAPELPA